MKLAILLVILYFPIYSLSKVNVCYYYGRIHVSYIKTGSEYVFWNSDLKNTKSNTFEQCRKALLENVSCILKILTGLIIITCVKLW